MRRARWLLLLATLATACAQTSPTTSLNGTWDFAFAADAPAADRLARFYENGFQGAGFQPTPVPSNWSLLGFEEPIYARPRQAGEGFYVRRFPAPENLTGKRVLLHFGGVWASAEVWLNGTPLGRHDSGFTEFAYDVTRTLKPGAENRLAVRVRQVTKDSMLDTNDDWSLGGIYRDVWLETMPAAAYIDRVETSTTFDAQFRDADLNVRVLVSGTQQAPYELRAILTGPDGKETQRTTLAVPAHRGTARDTVLTLHAYAPQRWTAETPNLYRLTVELAQGGNVTHLRTSPVGFRQVSTTGGVFRINGQAVKLRGVCRHDEHPDVGRATRREHWVEDLRLMKAANINMVRTSHYPPAEGFIALADEMGMYVMDEIPMGFGGEFGDDPSFMESGLRRAQETIQRDRNHPSVIIWSIGNEDPFTAMHLAAIRLVKGSDPTRPVLMPWRADDFLPPEVDILAPHYRAPSNLDQLAARSNRVVITTEYTHAYGEDGFGGLEESWRALTPGGFDNVTWENFTPRNRAPMVMHTRAHATALFVVLESALQMVSDSPDAYTDQKETEFLKAVPSTWDETRVIAGSPTSYITIARRRGNEWFLGSITGWDARELETPLAFLGKGNWNAEIYTDGPNAAKEPKETVLEKRVVTAATVLKCKLAPAGGFAVRFTPAP